MAARRGPPRRARPIRSCPAARRRSTSTPTPCAPTAPSSRATSSSRRPRPASALLAITDHDNLAGLSRADRRPARRPCRPASSCCPGVEINCLTASAPAVFEGELHILGFGVQPDDDAFEALLAGQRNGRLRPLRPDPRGPAPAGHVGRRRGRGARPRRDRVARPADRRPADDRQRLRHARSRTPSSAGSAAAGPPTCPRDGVGPVRAIGAIRAAGGLPVLAHFGEAGEPRVADPRPPGDRPGRPRGLLPDVRPGHRSTRSAGSPTSSAWSRPAAATSTATLGSYAEIHADDRRSRRSSASGCATPSPGARTVARGGADD